MHLNGYGSWGNCMNSTDKPALHDRFFPIYSPVVSNKIYSYDFFDNGEILYAYQPDKPDRRINTQNIDIQNCNQFHGDSYPERIDQYIQFFFSDFKIKPKKKINGWCSWNTYFQFLNLEKIKQQTDYASFINKNDADFKYILIDHGYSNIGELLINKDLWIYEAINYIQQKNLIPGLWINPFCSIYKDSMNPGKIKSKYMNFFMKSVAPNSKKYDQLYVASIYDDEYFKELSKKIFELYQLGVRLFKFDFNLYLFWQDAPYEDILARYKSFYSNLREKMDEATFIGCGVPLIESIGLFDYIRTTKDSMIDKSLPGMIRNYLQKNRAADIIRSNEVRKPFDGKLWHIDYDQIDDPKEFINNEGITLAGFDLENLILNHN